MPGPIRKRDAERRRQNKPEVATISVDLDALISQEVEIPEPDDAWEPLTKSFYESFARSGQAIFYEPSDWMTAYALMEILDRWLKPQDVKVGQEGSERDAGAGGNVNYIFEAKIVAMPGGVLTAILKGLSSLMATEGDRRRLRIELERKSARDAALSAAIIPIAAKRDEAFKAARAATQQSG